MAKRARKAFREATQDWSGGEAAYEVVDQAFRVAGTGSLGLLRVAILARGKGGVDDAWIFPRHEGAGGALGDAAPMARGPPARASRRRAWRRRRAQASGVHRADRSDDARWHVDVRAPPLAPGRQARPPPHRGAGPRLPLARHLAASSAAPTPGKERRLVPWKARDIEDLLDRASFLLGPPRGRLPGHVQ